METTLIHPDAEIKLVPLGNGKHRIRVLPQKDGFYVQGNGWETAYPVALIEKILQVKGPSYLCDEIAREEDPDYVPLNLEISLFSFVEEGYFGPGTRILDFGCGTGASCVYLGRSFPETEIVGVDLVPESLEIAEARKEFSGIRNARFLVSPSGDELPPGIGQFDGIIMSAVFEHLLPHERKRLMPLLWSVLKPGGILFINETPNRAFPLELHTTGLPLINYMPKGLALRFSRRFSSRVDKGSNWDTLLREGIRGGTPSEILKAIPKDGRHLGKQIPPSRFGRKDSIDIWYSRSVRKSGSSWKKTVFKWIAKSIQTVIRVSITPEVVIAIRKES